MPQIVDPSDRYWAVSAPELILSLQSAAQGLPKGEAARRLATHGKNLLKTKKRTDIPALLLSQFSSPIILILVFAAVLSFFLGDRADAVIILVIVGDQRPARLLAGARRRRCRGEAPRHRRRSRPRCCATGPRRRSPWRRSSRAMSCCSAPATSFPATACSSNRRICSSTRPRSPARPYPVEKTAGVLPADTPLCRRGPTPSSWAPTWSAARPRRRGAHRAGNGVRPGLRAAAAAAARDRVRDRGAPLRLSAHGSDPGPGDRHLRHQRLPATGPCWTPSCSRWRWPSG